MLKTFRRLISKIPEFIHWSTITLLIIVLVGGVLRCNIAVHNSYFGGDPGRDMLVGRHIAYFGERLWVGHAASGTPSIFYYPPYYYYGISLLEKINPNVLFIALFEAALQTLTIILVYGVARELGSSLFAVLSALFYSFSAAIVWQSNVITGIYFAAPFFWLSVLLLFRSIKDKFKPIVFSFSVILLLLGSSINYSLLPFVVPYIFLPLFRKKYSVKESILWLIAIVTLFILLWFPLWWYFGMQNFILRFTPSSHTLTTDWGLFLRMFKNLMMISNDLFWMKNDMFIGLGAAVVYVVLTNRRITKEFIIPCAAIVYILLLAAINKGPTYGHNFTVVQPFVFMVVAYVCSKTIEKATTILKVSMVAYVGILIYLFSNGFGYSGGYNEFEWTRTVTHEIMDQATIIRSQDGYKDDKFYIVRLSDPGNIGWSTSALLYWLEIDTHSQLVKLTNDTENIEQTNRDDYIFWLCRDFPDENTNHGCYKKYIAPETVYTLVRQLSLKTPGFYGYLLKKKAI